MLQGTNFLFSGAFGLDLQARVNVPRRGKPALPLSLQLDPDALTVSGSVAVGPWESYLLANRAVSGKSNALTGAYTLLLEGCADDGACFGTNTNLPWGDSPAAVKVSPAGVVQILGTLADATAISYAPPPSGQNPVNWINGFVVINSDAFPIPLTNQVALARNKLLVMGGSISNLTLTITASNGLFKGSFVHPVTKRVIPFNGAVVQNSAGCLRVIGGGWFLGANGEGGIIRLLFPPVAGVGGPSQLLAAEPLYDAAALLAPGTPDRGYAVPCVTDWNGDGKKDLLVGNLNGTVYYYQGYRTPLYSLSRP